MAKFAFRAVTMAPSLVVSLGIIAACSSGARSSGFAEERPRESDASAIFTDDASAPEFDFADVVADRAACALHCSPDLHRVLDCNDRQVEQCANDRGCANGACVEACAAARANKSSVGCDYFTFNPDAYRDDVGGCFAAFIANTWGAPVTIRVSRAGQVFDTTTFARIPAGRGQALSYASLPNGELAPGQVAILFLAGTRTAPVQCPAGITPAVSAVDAALHGTGIAQGFEIVTSAPVAAFDIYPYGGGNSAITSATLLLPTSAWDTNYVAIDAYAANGNVSFAPWVAIVGAEDATEVTLSSTVAVVGGGGLPATPKGQPAKYRVNKGQVLQFVQTEELIGTPIQSDKPIGVFGGNLCANIPSAFGWCDAAHQQIPPVRALGHEYVGVRHRDRYPGAIEAPPWRIVGAVDGTTLTYSPSAPPGAPSTIASGQVAEFQTSQTFVVKSQDADHPFYMAGYMTGCTTVSNGSGDCRGDPEFVNVVPPQQYLQEYVFYTDPTYPETHLVVVRAKGKNGFADVTLDCAGKLTGWTALGEYEWTRFDLVTGNFVKNGSCDNGRHHMESSAPFGLTVWGWGSAASGGAYRSPLIPGFYSQAVSYAYPAGAGVAPITTVVVPPILR